TPRNPSVSQRTLLATRASLSYCSGSFTTVSCHRVIVVSYPLLEDVHYPCRVRRAVPVVLLDRVCQPRRPVPPRLSLPEPAGVEGADGEEGGAEQNHGGDSPPVHQRPST